MFLSEDVVIYFLEESVLNDSSEESYLKVKESMKIRRRKHKKQPRKWRLSSTLSQKISILMPGCVPTWSFGGSNCWRNCSKRFQSKLLPKSWRNKDKTAEKMAAVVYFIPKDLDVSVIMTDITPNLFSQYSTFCWFQSYSEMSWIMSVG